MSCWLSAASPARFRLALVLILLAASGCASRRQRAFSPAALEDARRALEAWSRAAARFDSLPPARLLYESRVSQGVFRSTGTLAVREDRGTLEATLAGPFGSPIARYDNGALRGQGIRPLFIPPEQLRWLLAGVWRQEGPQVAGLDGGEALLRWGGAEEVDGIFDVATERFNALTVSRLEGRITASYSGTAAPWPERIDIEDAASGGKLRLTLLAVE